MFDQGLAQMASLDRSHGWTPEACATVANTFQKAADSVPRGFAEAQYNAGLAFMRCADHGRAAAYFRKILERDPKFHRARVQLARIEIATGKPEIGAMIDELQRAVLDSNFQNTEAFVELARLQMKRDAKNADNDGANDFARAKLNLHRALAVDDGYMPAYNQLAIYYFELSKRERSPRENRAIGEKSPSEPRDLALLVASQAIQRDPTYAPIRNTLGLLLVDAGELGPAAAAFATARKLDPAFFEAYMNSASVNLMFRGFAVAEDAYRAALKLRPSDYEAHLGLALALRGQLDGGVDAEAKPPRRRR